MVAQTITRESLAFESALIEFRRIGNEELLAEIDALTYQISDIAELYGSDAVALFDLTEQLRAAKQVLGWRERLHAGGHDVPNPHDSRYGVWVDLARQINEHADIVSIFERDGWVLS